MPEFWEAAFVDKQLMWGVEPTRSAVFAADSFARAGVDVISVGGLTHSPGAVDLGLDWLEAP